MKSLRGFLKLAMVLVIIYGIYWAAVKFMDFMDNLDQNIALIEQGFASVAKDLSQQIGKNQAKIVGPKESKNIRGIVQKEWLLISNTATHDGNKMYYAFKIFELPQPNSSVQWVVIPGFYKKSAGFEEYWGYDLEIMQQELINYQEGNPDYIINPFSTNLPTAEPYHSTLLLLKNFFNKINKAKH